MNPRKDKPSTLPMPYVGQSVHPLGGPLTSKLPLENPTWSSCGFNRCNSTQMPWGDEFGNQPLGFGLGSFNGVPADHGVEPPAEFSMKILYSAQKIGGVIGKGGFTVKLLQQDTGASLHVEDASAESDDEQFVSPLLRYSKASSMLMLESNIPNNVNSTRESSGGDLIKF